MPTRTLGAGHGRVLWASAGRQGGLRLRQTVCLDDWNQMGPRRGNGRAGGRGGAGDDVPAREDWSDGPWQTRNTRWRQTTLEKKTRSRRGQSRKTAVRRSRSTASRWALAGGDGGGDAPEPPPEKRQKLCKPPLWAQCITTPSNFSPQVRPALPPCHRAFSERPCSTRPAAPTRRSILCDISVHKSVKIARKEQRSAYPGPSCTSPAAPWPAPGLLAVLSEPVCSVCTRQRQGIVGIRQVRRGAG